MQRKLRWFIVSFIALLLVGCGPKAIYTPDCQALRYQYQLGESLKSDGIQVIVVGEEVTLMLPTSKFFYTGSNHLKNNASILNKIVAYINTYPVMNIQLKGYTDNAGDYTRNLALSRARAQAIAAYLWRHGLNGRLISADGYGCRNPYGLNAIEISFRQAPPNNVFH